MVPWSPVWKACSCQLIEYVCQMLVLWQQRHFLLFVFCSDGKFSGYSPSFCWYRDDVLNLFPFLLELVIELSSDFVFFLTKQSSEYGCQAICCHGVDGDGEVFGIECSVSPFELGFVCHQPGVAEQDVFVLNVGDKEL